MIFISRKIDRFQTDLSKHINRLSIGRYRNDPGRWSGSLVRRTVCGDLSANNVVSCKLVPKRLYKVNGGSNKGVEFPAEPTARSFDEAEIHAVKRPLRRIITSLVNLSREKKAVAVPISPSSPPLSAAIVPHRCCVRSWLSIYLHPIEDPFLSFHSFDHWRNSTRIPNRDEVETNFDQSSPFFAILSENFEEKDRFSRCIIKIFFLH